ncbi:flagellar basal body rod protein [Virgibacillus sp. W0430]|uniref:lmo0954 family membrane protein n=1 Tax=Virgibacillus sp. W0430 TaxID=3391580 RepID=UPI003F48558F
MKKLLLIAASLIALGVLLVNLGPLILLAVCVWLLYIVFKKFLQSDSTIGKIGWVALGLLLLSIALSNIYAVIGLVALYGLYVIYTSWKGNENEFEGLKGKDPFQNFEREWADLNK